MASKKSITECFDFLMYLEREAQRKYDSNPTEENLKSLNTYRNALMEYMKLYGIVI